MILRGAELALYSKAGPPGISSASIHALAQNKELQLQASPEATAVVQRMATLRKSQNGSKLRAATKTIGLCRFR